MSHEILVDWLIEYYSFEFNEISIKDKVRIITQTIYNNAQIFSPEYISKFPCSRCGWCCRQMHGCVYFNEKTNLCNRHDDLPYKICETYPWGGPYGLNLTINCTLLKKALLFYFNNVFEKMEVEKDVML